MEVFARSLARFARSFTLPKRKEKKEKQKSARLNRKFEKSRLSFSISCVCFLFLNLRKRYEDLLFDLVVIARPSGSSAERIRHRFGLWT